VNVQVPNANLSTFTKFLTFDEARQVATAVAHCIVTATYNWTYIPPIAGIYLSPDPLGNGGINQGVTVGVTRGDATIYTTKLTRDIAQQLTDAVEHYTVTYQ
jgi:hypothetical protein